jgi:glutamate-ammonia-ligase adenylyltransferase
MSQHNDTLPEALLARAETAWRAILERARESLADQLVQAFSTEPAASQLTRVLACSPFVADLARGEPQLLLDLVRSGDLQSSLAHNSFQQGLAWSLSSADADLQVVLRKHRQWHMLRIVWRDFCRLADTRETVRDTSLLAEAVIATAQEYTQAQLQRRYGIPKGKHSGQPQQLIVLAMGKLGARELNVSSDVDLIFAYPEAGTTDSADKAISNEEFFTHVGRGIISALDQVTADGFVFRVDMRLRPYGDSGALVHSFSALESYYQDQGRDWERYALIKARPVTGEPVQQDALMASLSPFVFRRYVDFSVIESLRGMKRMIVAEERRRGLQQNIKLGQGGIREVEFIVQCFQLIRGGRDLGLQQRELLAVLEECAELGCLPREAAIELRDAYLFLRDTEHAIQGYQDKQSQQLPQEEVPRLALATVMGFSAWTLFVSALDEHRSRVVEHFKELIATVEEDQPAQGLDPDGLWGESLSADALEELGFGQVEQSLQVLLDLQLNPRVATLQAEGRERLDRFMPQLLIACSEAADPDLSLTRTVPLVLSVVRRSAYLVLLLENPPAFAELVALCGASPWISEQLASYPVLLDELLDRASLYTAPDKVLLQDEMRQQVARLSADDLEAQMDALRYFKASHVLRVAASEIQGRLPLMQVSDKLTWIAEVILEQVLSVAWADLTRKYGQPNRESRDTGFAIFGYGKLGGIELGYGSDLDLVFVYDTQGGNTDGENSIDVATFYVRLGQRIIHILQSRMAMGELYEVDMRLRPSGESGMLATSAQAFHNYQMSDAWTWEHQALVRARFVAGDRSVAAKVEAVREEILRQPREIETLAAEVLAMRDKMREHLLPHGSVKEGEFHLKQGAGGIVDIEFMVQYAVLAWSCSKPELVRWSDNVRILETLGREGLFEQHECEALTGAYLAYRSAAHQLSLQQQPDTVPAGSFVDAIAAVSDKWQQLFAATTNDTTD